MAKYHPNTAQSVADIGCGPGNSTQFLAERFPDALIVGIDTSADMIQAAPKRLPIARFETQDIAAWADPGPFDVILANASLQWVPDHARLLPMLLGKLRAGGSLAVRVPDNLDEPAHKRMRSVAEDGPWAALLSEASKARSHQHPAPWYFRELRNQRAAVDIWRTVYHHRLAGGVDDVIEWFKGTGVRPFLDPLSPELRSDYLERYRGALQGAYPRFEDGSVLLAFPRLFLVATVGASNF